MNEYEYECDECGEKFELGEDSFYGQLDGDTNCSPFTRLTALCSKCIDRSYKELAAMRTRGNHENKQEEKQ